MMPGAIEASERTQAALLARVAGGVVLIGTIETLASAWGVTATVLLSALRDLMEDGRITVQMEPRSRLSVRLGDRSIAPADRPV